MNPEVFPIFVNLFYKINLNKFHHIHPYLIEKVSDLYNNKKNDYAKWNCETYTTLGLYNLNEDQKFDELLYEMKIHVTNFANIFKVKNCDVQSSYSWLNLSHPGTYQEYHMHTKSHFSAVYYVKVPENSGNIIFQSHESFTDMFPLNVNHNNFENSKTFIYPPKEGDLIIFRSNLQHMVSTNKSDDIRVSLSSNFSV